MANLDKISESDSSCENDSRSGAHSLNSQTKSITSLKSRSKAAISDFRDFLVTIFSSLLYGQDVFQDIIVTSTSLSSEEKYSILSNLEVEEKKIGYFMVSIFCVCSAVAGFDILLKMKQMILLKTHKKIYFIVLPACLLNLGPV